MLKAVVVSVATAAILSLTGCANLSQEARLAKLEQQVQKDHDLLYDVTRRLGLGEFIRPQAISYDYAAREGDVNAPVTIMEFTDLNCPYCATFNKETWPVLKQKYVANGQLQLVAQDFPLTQLHPTAGYAALALRCAVKQDADYAAAKQALFEMKTLTKQQAEKFVEQFKLDQAQFTDCTKDSETQNLVRNSVQVGRDLGVKSTPTFFVGLNENGKLTHYDVVTGARTVEDFSKIIEKFLKLSKEIKK